MRSSGLDVSNQPDGDVSNAAPTRMPSAGLGTFGAADAAFFLRLVPGPRSRDGLPECIRFWKTRLEETDPDRTFRVGLIYGPDGSGKSSLLRAGLVPSLADSVITVCVEATPADTEARLLRAIRSHVPGLPGNLALVETLAALRQGQGLPAGRKFVVILDQLERWLGALHGDRRADLVRALRQCDGRRLQSILVVRDDCWTSTMRLFREVEVALLEGHNALPVGHFDLAHARQVLVTLGRAIGALPEGSLIPAQERFLDQALARLAENGKVLPVRLNRFVETVRGLPWKPETMREATRRGRAEQRLAEQAARWGARPEACHLPGVRAWLEILVRARRLPWTDTERRMMRAATYHHLVRGLALLAIVAFLGVIGLYGWRRLDEQRRAAHAHELVSQLLAADIGQVPGLLDTLDDYRAWAEPELTRIADDPGRSPRHRLRACLALSPAEEGRTAYLLERLLTANPEDLRAIRTRLLARGDRLTGPLWEVLESPNADPAAKLRAACALAFYAPNDARWPQTAGPVVGQLVREPPWLLPQWLALLRPARKNLLAELAVVCRSPGQDPTEREAATRILADYAADVPEVLYELILDAEPWQYGRLLDKVTGYRDDLSGRMAGELWRRLPPGADEPARDRLARRQANAAVTLFQIRAYVRVWPVLRQSADPRLRSFLIHALPALGADPLPLAQRWYDEPDASVRRALLLSLGEFGPERLPPETRDSLKDDLLRAYREDPDPGIHGAIAWLLRRWGADDRLKPVDETGKGRKPAAGRSWYVDGQGHTLVLVNDQGAPARDEKARCFAIATREVSAEQFRRFRPNLPRGLSAQGDYPANGVSWLDAVAYCRWLSEQESVPEEQMCYPPIPQIQSGLKLSHDYVRRTGYRLPTEWEWEVACRAGTASSRLYGEADDLLPKYAWYERNAQKQPQPIGRLKPNDLGLFDLLGNTMEWCHGIADGPVAGPEGRELELIRGDVLRVARGGAFTHPAEGIRATQRDVAPAATRWPALGFRVARTVRPPP
jgi:hypothetical protein